MGDGPAAPGAGGNLLQRLAPPGDTEAVPASSTLSRESHGELPKKEDKALHEKGADSGPPPLPTGSDPEAPPSPSQSPVPSAAEQPNASMQYAEIFVLIFVWWAAAVWVVIGFKRTSHAFQHPFTISGFGNFVAGILAIILVEAHERVAQPPPLPAMSWNDKAILLFIGLLNGAEIGCGNKALQVLPVATHTMLGSFKVLFQIISSIFWKLELISLMRIVSAFTFILGGVLQGLGKVHHGSDEIECLTCYQQGVFLEFLGLTIGSQRIALLQLLLQHHSADSPIRQMSKLQLIRWVLPVTGVVSLCLAGIFELPASDFKWTDIPVMGVIGFAIGILLVVLSELKLVQLTSAVVLQILMTLHAIPIFLGGVIVLGEQPSILCIWGFATCIVAAGFYILARRIDSKPGPVEHYREVQDQDPPEE